MQTVKRRCAQTAHISLHSFNFQRARTQNKQHTRTSGVLPSCIQNFVTSVSTRAPFRPSASLRLFVFGEALSREGCRCPQEEKCKPMSFSRHTQCLQEIFAPADQKSCSRKTPRGGKSGKLPESPAPIPAKSPESGPCCRESRPATVRPQSHKAAIRLRIPPPPADHARRA